MSAPKPIAAIDIDEVLAPLVFDFCRYLEQKYNISIPINEGFDYFNTHKLVGITKTQLLSDLDRYSEEFHFHHARPIKGAVEALSALSQRYDLVVVTARAHTMRQATEEWLERHYPGMFEDVHIVGHVGSNDRAISKHVMLERLNAVALIDDAITNVADAALMGRQGILFGDYPWNQASSLPQDVVRAKDWQEVRGILLT